MFETTNQLFSWQLRGNIIYQWGNSSAIFEYFSSSQSRKNRWAPCDSVRPWGSCSYVPEAHSPSLTPRWSSRSISFSWLVVGTPTPLKSHFVQVSWDDYTFPIEWKFRKKTNRHQVFLLLKLIKTKNKKLSVLPSTRLGWSNIGCTCLYPAIWKTPRLAIPIFEQIKYQQKQGFWC